MNPREPKAFDIAIPEKALADLQRRLQSWRQVEDFANDDWRYGMNGDYLQELIAYWADDYDWRVHEARMNDYDHFKVEIDGVPIHYMHVRGDGPDPVPLIMTHGWPWTFWDFRHLIEPLSHPQDDSLQSFDLIIPSLPGFGFSSPLRESGIGLARTAELWDKLMYDVLGYQRYAAHGGDWGSLVTAALAHLAPQRVIAVHESMGGFLGLDYSSIPADDYAEDEVDFPVQVAKQAPHIGSHMAVHTSDPQTLAYALNDSPAGLASWIVERRRAWSDCDGDVEQKFSKDELLTTVSIYWHTKTIGTSMRFYWESLRGAVWQPLNDQRPTVSVPSGFAVFPKDNILVPRKTAERYANVQHWTVMPSGGHFGPAEEPQLLVDDIRKFFRKLR